MEGTSQTTPIPSHLNKSLWVGARCINHEAFILYVRTKQFLKTRLRGIDDELAIHIPMEEIESRFFPQPKFNCKQELHNLVEAGLLRIIEGISPKTGHKMFRYEALQPGKVDLYLIKPKARNFDPDTHQMIALLKRVTVDQGAPELPPYFESFLNFRDDCMNLFVTVDYFAGRVHTPISNLHRPIRPYLLLDGQPTIGIDVTTMQPLLLGKLLTQAIGTNEYSTWINSGEDIYIKLQQKAGLDTREQGKKRFFEILFARPNNQLATMFGDSDWITWINWYKTQPEPRNPHNAGKPHSNLAWSLQTTEVNAMRKVWHGLIGAGIPFLSVHDEIIVKQSDRQMAEQIFRAVLDDEFTFFKLNVKQAIPGTQTDMQAGIPPQADSVPQCHPIYPELTPAHIQFVPLPPRPDLKHDYFDENGILRIHWPDLPEIC